MTDNTEARIRLAEWMGWRRMRVKNPDPGIPTHYWAKVGQQAQASCPDPFTNDTDCMALAQFMAEKGYAFDISIVTDRHRVLMSWVDGDVDRGYKAEAKHWQGDDYKQGVCELALKVLNDDK